MKMRLLMKSLWALLVTLQAAANAGTCRLEEKVNGLKGVLLDVDGTLIDSNDAHAAAWMDALAEANIAVDAHAVRRRIGMGGDNLLPEVAGLAKESDLGARIDERRGVIFRERYLPALRAFPGARSLLLHLKSRGLKLVVATSASQKDLQSLLAQASLTDVIDDAVTSSDAKRSKPAPDIVEAALRRSGLSPEAAIMLGDTPYDVAAAKAAGVSMIAFTSGGWTREELLRAGAAEVYSGPDEFLQALQCR